MTTGKILFHVQHLLGIGHLIRAGRICAALTDAGFSVTFVSGGMPMADLPIAADNFVQLPPMRAADANFSALVDATGTPIDETWRNARRDRLLALFHDLRPQIILLEMFPFGRRQLAFELDPLLQTAHDAADPPLIVSSVRDILVPPSRPKRITETIERVKRYFDLVLVHGDPDLIPFHETFPGAKEIADHITYTGYVTGPPTRLSLSQNEVLVSAGGGAVAEQLIPIALAARPLCTLADMPWRVITGANTSPERLAAYRDAGPPGVIFEHTRTDFRDLLANARLSISQGGYNTIIETLSAGTPALCMPFAEDGESEQTHRCRAVAARGWLHMIDQDDANPQSFAAAIDRAAAAHPPPVTLKMDGAATTARCLATALAQKTVKSG